MEDTLDVVLIIFVIIFHIAIWGFVGISIFKGAGKKIIKTYKSFDDYIEEVHLSKDADDETVEKYYGLDGILKKFSEKENLTEQNSEFNGISSKKDSNPFEV